MATMHKERVKIVQRWLMVPLSSLLAIDALNLRLVVPGEGEVRWVATSELADPTPFLEGGEVLLTTGLNAQGWRAEWRRYVERLRRTGVTAIGIGTGLTHRHPPAGLVKACRAEGMPLFEVPTQTSFVSISRAAVELLEGAEQALARRVVVAQHDLTAAALGAAPERDVIRVLSRLTGGTAAVLDVDGAIRTGPFGPRGDESSVDLDEPRVREEVDRIRPLGARGASGFSDPLTSTTVQPIGVGGTPQGYLVVAFPGRPDEPGRVASTTAVSLLSLISERLREQRLQDRDFRSRAWTLAEAGNLEAATAVLVAAGLTVPESVQVLAVAGDPSDVLDRAEPRRGFALAVEREGLVALAFTAPVPANLVAALEGLGARVGIGPPGVGLADLAGGWARARSALEATSAARTAVAWEELSDRGILGLVDTDAAAAFAEQLVGDLDDVLRMTLRSFLDHHGSRVATAQALGVHRNTVRNRIEDIEARWGRSLEEPATRMDAWAAMEILVRQGSPGAR